MEVGGVYATKERLALTVPRSKIPCNCFTFFLLSECVLHPSRLLYRENGLCPPLGQTLFSDNAIGLAA